MSAFHQKDFGYSLRFMPKAILLQHLNNNERLQN